MTWTRPNSKCLHRQFRTEAVAVRELARIRLDWKMKVAQCSRCNYYRWEAKDNG